MKTQHPEIARMRAEWSKLEAEIKETRKALQASESDVHRLEGEAHRTKTKLRLGDATGRQVKDAAAAAEKERARMEELQNKLIDLEVEFGELRDHTLAAERLVELKLRAEYDEKHKAAVAKLARALQDAAAANLEVLKIQGEANRAGARMPNRSYPDLWIPAATGGAMLSTQYGRWVDDRRREGVVK